jgi:hypothetical protein
MIDARELQTKKNHEYTTHSRFHFMAYTKKVKNCVDFSCYGVQVCCGLLAVTWFDCRTAEHVHVLYRTAEKR